LLKSGSLALRLLGQSSTKPHLAYLQVEEQQEAVGLDVPLEVQSEGDGQIFIPCELGV
jgi:hypothetical protein